MRAHQKRGISRISVDPIRYYGGPILNGWRAYHATWLDGAAMLRRGDLRASHRQSLAMTRRYRLEQSL